MKRPEPQIRYWSYPLDEGWVAMAGKSDLDNDLVSFRLSRATDWWLHVSGMPGSHVLLRQPDDPGAEPSKAIQLRAAQIAAYHSKARGGGNVTVNICRACNVSKPPHSPAGLVEIDHYRTLRVRPLPPDGAP